MIIDSLHAHLAHQPIEGLCCGTLEPCVSRTRTANAIHDVITLQSQLHHLLDDSFIVLQVSIDSHSQVGKTYGSSKSGHKGILMSTVVSKTDTGNASVLCMQLLNHAPCGIMTSIIYIEYSAIMTDNLLHSFKHSEQMLSGLLKNGLFVITWYNDCEARFLLCFHSLSIY